MSYLVRKNNEVYRHQIEAYLGKDAKVGDALDYIFGHYNNDYRSMGGFTLRVWSKDKRKWWQRLNMFWAMPLTVIVLPFQWVVHGKSGWDTKTKLGTFILKVTGNLHDS